MQTGYFRTDFLDGTSLQATATQIDDYAATAGAVRARAATLNHRQPGDPERLARAIIALVVAKEPPLRLPLGTDAVVRIEEKNAFVARELATWRDLAVSTDFPPGLLTAASQPVSVQAVRRCFQCSTLPLQKMKDGERPRFLHARQQHP